MKIQCDVCEKKEASVFCAADEAALCEDCDHRVHHANKLASKHQRFSLSHPSFKDAPLCDICQERRAFLFCREDRAILCRECDIPIHKANELTQTHNRFLLTGVRISASSSFHPKSSTPSTISSEPCSRHNKSVNDNDNVSSYEHDKFSNNTSYYSSNSNNNNMCTNNSFTTPNYNQFSEEGSGSISTSNTISGYLMETLPGWRLEDLLDSSAASHCKTFDYSNSGGPINQQVEEHSMGSFSYSSTSYAIQEQEQEQDFYYQEGPLVPSYLPPIFLQ